MTYPIVLAHGVCRFDIVWKDAFEIDNNDDEELDNLHYFKGIRTMLLKNGFSVYHSNVGWATNVDSRANDLKKDVLKVLEEESCEKVNIIAHSMGGLDARHMMFNDRNSGKIHDHVASLTTISTPHNGSPFADWGIEHLPHVIPLARKLGLDLTALEDLKTDTCESFNYDPEVMEFEQACEKHIRFQTVAGKQDIWSVFDPLKVSFFIIEKKEGDNDGLVSVESAKWHNRFFVKTLENTDHLNELGWWDRAQIFSRESDTALLKRIHNFYLNVAKDLP
jgi:triacylglycerol lipase